MDWGCSQKRKEWDSGDCNECVEDDNAERESNAHCNYGFVSFL